MRTPLVLIALALLVVTPTALAQTPDLSGLRGITYRFDKSVPFSVAQLVQVGIQVQLDIDTDWDQKNGICTVYFLDYAAFEKRFGSRAMAFYEQYPCSYYFNYWDYPTPRLSKFIQDLIHEILHSWGVGHSENKESLMYKDYLPLQKLQLADRFALWIAQQKKRRTNSNVREKGS